MVLMKLKVSVIIKKERDDYNQTMLTSYSCCSVINRNWKHK